MCRRQKYRQSISAIPLLDFFLPGYREVSNVEHSFRKLCGVPNISITVSAVVRTLLLVEGGMEHRTRKRQG